MKKFISILIAVLIFALNCAVVYCAGEDYVTGVRSDIRIVIDGAEYDGEDAPVIIDGRTYLPLRAVAEALGADITYDEGEQMVKITMKSKTIFPGDDWVESYYIGEDGKKYICFRDENGDITLKTNYEKTEFPKAVFSIRGFQEGLAEFMKYEDGEIVAGYMDVYGNEIMMNYTMTKGFSEGLAAVTTEHGSYPKYGFINKAGEMVIPERYGWTSEFSEGLCAVSDVYGFNCYYINKDGEKVFDGKEFGFANAFSGGYAIVKTKGNFSPGRDDKYSYIDHTGNLVTDKEWDSAGNFKNGYAMVWDGDVRMRIDTNFEVVEVLES